MSETTQLPDDGKELYVVDIIHRTYVYAYNSSEAAEFMSDIVTEEEPDTFTITRVQENVLNWPDDSCVWHDDLDKLITIADVMEVIQRRNSSISIES